MNPICIPFTVLNSAAVYFVSCINVNLGLSMLCPDTFTLGLCYVICNYDDADYCIVYNQYDDKLVAGLRSSRCFIFSSFFLFFSVSMDFLCIITICNFYLYF